MLHCIQILFWVSCFSRAQLPPFPRLQFSFEHLPRSLCFRTKNISYLTRKKIGDNYTWGNIIGNYLRIYRKWEKSVFNLNTRLWTHWCKDYESGGGSSDFWLPTSDFRLPISNFRLDSSVKLDCRSIRHAGINWSCSCKSNLAQVQSGNWWGSLGETKPWFYLIKKRQLITKQSKHC